MEIIKQTDTQLVFKVKSIETTRYFYWGVLIVISTFFLFVFVLIYDQRAVTGILLILLIFELIYLHDSSRADTVTVNKSKDSLEIKANNKVIYVSDYSLQEIQRIKTVIELTYWSSIISSLVIVLRSNEEKIVETARYGLPFFVDLQANRQAKIGKKISEYLGVPYRDSEYTSMSI